MRHIRLNSMQESILGATVKKFRINGFLAPKRSSQNTVHSVNHTHAASFDKDRRQACLGLRQPGDV